jgi:hypothetical protein
MTLADARFEFGIAEGGRFCERSRWRLAAPELGMLPERLFIAGELLGRLFEPGMLPLPGRLFVIGVLCVGIFCCVAAR